MQYFSEIMLFALKEIVEDIFPELCIYRTHTKFQVTVLKIFFGGESKHLSGNWQE